MDLFEKDSITNDQDDGNLNPSDALINMIQSCMDRIGLDNNISVPIRKILLDKIDEYDATYDECAVWLLRKYYIALLNLGFIEVGELSNIVEKFVSKINYIEIGSENSGILIENGEMYIGSDLTGEPEADIDEEIINIYNYIDPEVPYDEEEKLRIEYAEVKLKLEFYKSVSSVLFNTQESNLNGISNIVTEIMAEKIWYMDELNYHVVIPSPEYEVICNTTITTRTGYIRENLPLSLFKQFCIAFDMNENEILDLMLHKDVDSVINESFNVEKKFYLYLIDMHFDMYLSRVVHDNPVEDELKFIESLQIQLNKVCKKSTPSYLAFLALVTTDELRTKLASQLEQSN